MGYTLNEREATVTPTDKEDKKEACLPEPRHWVHGQDTERTSSISVCNHKLVLTSV